MSGETVKERVVDLAHEEGYTGSPPLSVYVHGHDIDENEARTLAQSALDEWTDDHRDDEAQSHLVAVGQKTHLRKVPAAPGSEFEGHIIYHTGYPAGPGATPIWEFEVDEHLVPRCQVVGCDMRWSSGPGYYLPVRMCRHHARLTEVKFRVATAQRMLQVGWILGEPEDSDYFGQWTEQQRREYAVEHLDGAVKELNRSLREASSTITELAEHGFTLPLEYEITPEDTNSATDVVTESEIH